MSDRVTSIPKTDGLTEAAAYKSAEQVTEGATEEKPNLLTQEDAEMREKVFFEDDEKVRLRDGKTYCIPPLGLLDARKLMKQLNSIDSGVIIANLIPDDEDENDRFDALMDVLLMAFKPYYKHMTADYLGEYIDLETAKVIIDSMIGLNGLKKSM
ncbi:DNA polymerase III subunit gamma/tau [Paenibacillus sp. CAU 1782]